VNGTLHWSMACPDGKGGWTFASGTGKTQPSPQTPKDSIVVAGNLQASAVMLERLWKRPVAVPAKLKGTVVARRKLSGSHEEIAKALGLTVSDQKR
jgi:hypothetical protein